MPPAARSDRALRATGSRRRFSYCGTRQVADLLTGHSVSTAYELGWATLKNGELLRCAEEQGFEVLVTTDTNLRYQQNLAARQIAVVVLTTTSWPRIRVAMQTIASAVNSASAGAAAGARARRGAELPLRKLFFQLVSGGTVAATAGALGRLRPTVRVRPARIASRGHLRCLVPMKFVEYAVHDGGENKRSGHDENKTCVQSIHACEELTSGSNWPMDRPHSTQQHC